jgi:peroxiredoxin Q/BCP
MLKAGDPAPDFALQNDDAQLVRLSAQRDKPVVLFFYPEDDTPGCTIECKQFRDARAEFESKAYVYGISPDDVASHQAFRDKYSLNFPLLVDEGHAVADAFGVWGKKGSREGIVRTTFIIATDGRIQEVFEHVRPDGHAAQVLAAL